MQYLLRNSAAVECNGQDRKLDGDFCKAVGYFDKPGPLATTL